MDGRDPINDIHVINEELKKYNKDIENRPQVIAANKVDLLDDMGYETVIEMLKEEFPEVKDIRYSLYLQYQERVSMNFSGMSMTL